MADKVVAYYRVSTQRQGQSGLGLEAQRASVAGFARAKDCTIIAEYTEIESGKRTDRPELARAIAHAQRVGARLVVAKLDRLARNAAFTAKLQASKVPFVACDMPDANELTIGIMALIAQHEAKATSDRTKAALAAVKARGVTLGNPKMTAEIAKRGADRAGRASRKGADDAYRLLAPYCRELKAAGLSLREIAERLNGEGYATRQGKAWNAMQVSRVLGRKFSGSAV